MVSFLRYQEHERVMGNGLYRTEQRNSFLVSRQVQEAYETIKKERGLN